MNVSGQAGAVNSDSRRPAEWGDTSVSIALAIACVVLHTLTNNHYGFHRDELAAIDDARHLAWGYVAYPPLTPFVGRVALTLAGTSLMGIRFFGALAQGAAMVLAAWMARELGGRRPAQVVAAAAVAVAPVSFVAATLFEYVAFDYLWWVALAWMTIRLLASEDPRWWLGIGSIIGLGMMTKYSMVFLVAGLGAGLLFTPARRFLRSPWLWGGVALSLLIFLPNLIWQVRHGFITLEFLRSIHARDIRMGRTDGFLVHQLFIGANPFTLPLWAAGLYYYFARPAGRRFRVMGWMFLVPLILFTLVKGRDYYLAPAYPMLLAAGSVVWQGRMDTMRSVRARTAGVVAGAALALGSILVCGMIAPIPPVNSSWWKTVSAVNENLPEEIGWPELVDTVAAIRDSLPAEERSHLGVLAGNYGEAGAIDLYGPALGLPEAISGTNSYWLRGYPDPPPRTLIVLGLSRAAAGRLFESCELAGHNGNRFGVRNEESQDHPDIFVCRGLRQSWPEFWKASRAFG
jgi:hypothetical protein